MELGIAVLALCAGAVGWSGWRIWHARRFMAPPEAESIKTLTDRFERDMEDLFRNWEKKK